MADIIPFHGRCPNCNTSGNGGKFNLGDRTNCLGCGKPFTVGAGTDADLEESVRQLLKQYGNAGVASPQRGDFARAEVIAGQIAQLLDYCINRVESTTLEQITMLRSVEAVAESGYEEDQWYSLPSGKYDPESLRSRATTELQRRGLIYYQYQWITAEQFDKVVAEETKRAAFEKSIGFGRNLGLYELGIGGICSILFAAIFGWIVLTFLRMVG